jgi:lysophospholipase
MPINRRRSCSACLTTNFSANNFTHDKVLYEGLQKVAIKFPDALTGGPSMSWLYAALRECSSLQKMPCPSMAGLVYFGENDKTVNIEATKAVVSRWTNARFPSSL